MERPRRTRSKRKREVLDTIVDESQDGIDVKIVPASGEPFVFRLKPLANVRAAKNAIATIHGHEEVRQQLLVAEASDDDAEPLDGSVLLKSLIKEEGSVVLFLVLRDLSFFRWKSCGRGMSISGDDHEVLSGNENLVHNGKNCVYSLATGSVVAADRGACGRWYWEVSLLKDDLLEGEMWFNIGAVRPGLDLNRHHGGDSKDVCFLFTHDGGLYGQEKYGDDEQGADRILQGDRVGVLVENETVKQDGSSGPCAVRFFVNGVEFGKGFRLVKSPDEGLVLGVEMYYRTQQVALVADATPPE